MIIYRLLMILWYYDDVLTFIITSLIIVITIAITIPATLSRLRVRIPLKRRNFSLKHFLQSLPDDTAHRNDRIAWNLLMNRLIRLHRGWFDRGSIMILGSVVRTLATDSPVRLSGRFRVVARKRTVSLRPLALVE